MSSALTQKVPASPTRSAGAGKARVVAVSSTSDEKPGTPHRVRLNSTYIIALESAGLIPLLVPPLASTSAAREILAIVDGLVLTGGEDVDSTLYGQERHSKGGVPNRARDATEIALVLAAREMAKPVLAICRGPQLLNVALGGTLIQDIGSQIAGAVEHNARDDRGARVHDVAIEPGSRIAEAMGAVRLRVNSLHHQSVGEIAPGLRITGRAPDGVIEGIESESPDWWAIAVQWHPEEMNDSPEPWDRGLFRAFATSIGNS